MADAPIATATCHTREPKSGDAEFGLETVVELVELVAADVEGPAADELEGVTVEKREVVAGRDKGAGTEDPGADEGRPVGAGTAVGPPPVMLPVAKEGGGTAFEGSLSAPVPQGMAAFDGGGWTGLVGGVVEPSRAAMVKRVVHCGAVAPGAVNW